MHCLAKFHGQNLTAKSSAKCYILSNEAIQEDNDMEIGKCPNCHEMLSENDIEHRRLRAGILTEYFAMVCKKCETIIGFVDY